MIEAAIREAQSPERNAPQFDWWGMLQNNDHRMLFIRLLLCFHDDHCARRNITQADTTAATQRLTDWFEYVEPRP